MNPFRKKLNALSVIIGIVVAGIGWPQGAKANNTFNETESAVIALSGTPPFTIIREDGGYLATLNADADTMTVSAPYGAVYTDSRELSCGQKVRVRDKDGKETEQTAYYDGSAAYEIFPQKDKDSEANPVVCSSGCTDIPNDGYIWSWHDSKLSATESGNCDDGGWGRWCPGIIKSDKDKCVFLSSDNRFGYCASSRILNKRCVLELCVYKRKCQEPELPLPEDLDHGNSCPTVGNPISVYNGNKYEATTDMSFPTSHRSGFDFTRYYNSQSATDGILGFGQTHSYSVSLDPAYNFEGIAYLRITDADGHGSYFTDFADVSSGRWKGVFKERTSVEKNGGTYIWHRQNDRKYGFDNSGRLIWIDDEIGRRQTVAYDTQNRLESVTDQASARVLTFHYDADNRLHHIIGPVTEAVSDGIQVTYSYDPDGNLETVTYADGSGFQYLYEDPYDAHNLTAKKNLAGHLISEWTYDDQDRAETNTNRYGKGVSIEYLSKRKVLVTDA